MVVDGFQKVDPAILSRFEAGEEIELADALALFDIRRPRECGKLEGCEGRGRSGDPHEPLTEIPPNSWAFMRWEVVELHFVLVTPSGKRIYDARVRACSRQIAEAPPEPTVNEPVALTLIDPDMAIAAIAGSEDGKVWTLGGYRDALRPAGLSVTADKLRVPGITIMSGKIVRGAGPILLRNALFVARYRFEFERGEIVGGVPRMSIARRLVQWLAEHHPDLLPAGRGGEATFHNEVSRLIRETASDAPLVNVGLSSQLRPKG